MVRLALALPIGAVLAVSAFQAFYPAEIALWRHDREARLTADGGWLTVAGLFWLHPGANSFGKAPDAAIALPDGPAHAGVFTFDGRRVTLTMDGTTREVTPDSDTGAVKVMVATKPVDFRKGAEGLAALVREAMNADPYCGAVYGIGARSTIPRIGEARRG